jgi:hypothetical protein
MPPEPQTPSRAAHWHSRLASTRVRLLFPRGAPQVSAGFEILGDQHPSGPHWYLAFVGIEPGEQRRGLGRQLLEPVLEQADRTSHLCYLETPFPDTRPFYLKLRFNETAVLRPVAGAPPIWTMTRQPLPPSGAPGDIREHWLRRATLRLQHERADADNRNPLDGIGEETGLGDPEERNVLTSIAMRSHVARSGRPSKPEIPVGRPSRIGTTTPSINVSATMKFVFDDMGSITCPV